MVVVVWLFCKHHVSDLSPGIVAGGGEVRSEISDSLHAFAEGDRSGVVRKSEGKER